MIVDALAAARYNVYGFLPPEMSRPHGSHVFSVSVTFAVTTGMFCGGDAMQDVSAPSTWGVNDVESQDLSVYVLVIV